MNNFSYIFEANGAKATIDVVSHESGDLIVNELITSGCPTCGCGVVKNKSDSFTTVLTNNSPFLSKSILGGALIKALFADEIATNPFNWKDSLQNESYDFLIMVSFVQKLGNGRSSITGFDDVQVSLKSFGDGWIFSINGFSANGGLFDAVGGALGDFIATEVIFAEE